MAGLARNLRLESERQDVLAAALTKIGKEREDLVQDGKSEAWKIELAASLKAQTTATNRWLSENLRLGALHEVSRKLSAWSKRPKT